MVQEISVGLSYIWLKRSQSLSPSDATKHVTQLSTIAKPEYSAVLKCFSGAGPCTNEVLAYQNRLQHYVSQFSDMANAEWKKQRARLQAQMDSTEEDSSQ
jgi:hypothetical protein